MVSQKTHNLKISKVLIISDDKKGRKMFKNGNIEKKDKFQTLMSPESLLTCLRGFLYIK